MRTDFIPNDSASENEVTPQALSWWRPPFTVTLLVLVLAQLPFLALFVRDLWRYRPHYEFFPVLLVVAALLARKRWPRVAAEELGKLPVDELEPLGRLQWAERGLFGLALVLSVAGWVAFSPWLTALAAMFTAGGLALRLAGRRAISQLLPVWLLAWVAIPPPGPWDQEFVRSMQLFTSRISSVALDLLNVKHLAEGSIIRLPGKQLFVAEACSGVHSQLVLIACSAMFVVATRRSLIRGGLLIASGLFWAVLVNTTRVVGVAAVAARWNVDLASGWQHEVLGYSLVACGVILLASTDAFLGVLLTPIPSTLDERRFDMDDDPIVISDQKPRNPFSRWFNQFLADRPAAKPDATRKSPAPLPPAYFRNAPIPWSLAVAFAVLGVLQLASIFVPESVPTLSIEQADVVYEESSLPSKIGDCELAEYKLEERGATSDMGHFSQIWRYQTPEATSHVSVDYPFVGWHELTVCYTGRGWLMQTREVRSDDSAAGDYVEVELIKPAGEKALLFFSIFDCAGRPLVPPAQKNSRSMVARLTANPLTQRLLGTQATVAPADAICLQVQQLVVGPIQLTEEGRTAARERFLKLRRQLHELWLAARDQ